MQSAAVWLGCALWMVLILAAYATSRRREGPEDSAGSAGSAGTHPG